MTFFQVRLPSGNPLRLVLQICAVLTVLGVASRAFAFDISYRYELMTGGKRDICRHMLKTYNRLFRKPWSDRWVAQKPDQYGIPAETLYSVHPTSPEFNAITWLPHMYIANSIKHTALFTRIDIDNDGTKELVVHVGFFNGSPGSRDYLYVFPLESIDLHLFRTHKEFLEHFAPKRKALLGYPIHERLFIYKDRTYIHGYVFTPRTFPGADPAEPFGPPEYILINEYLGGDATDAEVQARSRSMKLVCKFRMVQEAQR